MKLLHFILIFLLIAVVYSQDGSSREILSDSLYEQENRKSIESMMIWKLTEELELEVDQAEKFFPRFRQQSCIPGGWEGRGYVRLLPWPQD